MEAANRGAADAGAPSIGFNIHSTRTETKCVQHPGSDISVPLFCYAEVASGKTSASTCRVSRSVRNPG